MTIKRYAMEEEDPTEFKYEKGRFYVSHITYNILHVLNYRNKYMYINITFYEGEPVGSMSISVSDPEYYNEVMTRYNYKEL